MGCESISRRRFLSCAGQGCLLAAAPICLSASSSFDNGREARYWEKLPEKRIRCTLCPNECRVADLERGSCGVRENRDGAYRTLVYGNPCAVHIDPVEKKPLFHYMPGAQAFSLATAGCNFACRFCQNWEISQKRPEQVRSQNFPPEAVVAAARSNGCRLVAHTYTEPVVSFEYMLDCAVLGRRQNIPGVMISNGYIKPEPMRELCRHLGAVKIDLKSFRDTFYREQCSGRLAPVLETLKLIKASGVWLEIVVLLIPTLNDSQSETVDMCRWIFRELGPDVPLHFTRFYPTFQIRNLPPTPPSTLEKARQIALEAGIHYVYIGNLLSEAENTRCHSCHALLIRRQMFSSEIVGMEKNRCRACNTVIPGVFSG
jgi:pyruvate formate lyase activating enzyme